MEMNLRQTERFAEIGKVECQELCAIHGILDDISSKGCKIHFNCNVSVDMEEDYELTIKPSKNIHEGFLLIGHPKWFRNIGQTTEIGFSFLRSPDTPKFEKYIEEVHKDKVNLDDMDPSDVEKWLS